MRKFAAFVINHKIIITIIFAVLTAVCAVGMFFVDVNYNDTDYLPEDSTIAQGLDKMYGEFGAGGNATVMVSDVSIYQAYLYKEQIQAVDGVDHAMWVDDILISESIGTADIREKLNNKGYKDVTDAKCVLYMWQIISNLDTLLPRLQEGMPSGLNEMTELVDIILGDKKDDPLFDRFFPFMLELQGLLSGDGGFDLTALGETGTAELKSQLGIFYNSSVKTVMGAQVTEWHALYQVSFDKSDYDADTIAAIGDIKALGENVYVSGNAAMTYKNVQLVSRETLYAMLIAGVIVCVILLLFTTSYWDPVLILASIGVAIVLNMGSNYLLTFTPVMKNGISYLTQGVASLLQLACTIDYCIYLLNRYKQGKVQGLPSKDAMVEALSSSISPILSSALVSILSSLALTFMTYKLGLDMGLVLAKGILMSLISVFLLMPNLILFTEKLIDKTTHKTFNFSFRKFSKGLVKSRFWLPFLIIAVMIPCVYFQTLNNFTYGSEASLGRNEDKIRIEEVFGYQNQAVVLVPVEMSDLEVTLAQRLGGVEGVASVQSLAVIEQSGFGQMLPPAFIRQFKNADANGNYNYTRIILFLNAPEEGEETTAIIERVNVVIEDVTVGRAAVTDTEVYLLGASSATLNIKGLLEKDNPIIEAICIISVTLILMLIFKSFVLPLILILVIEGAIYINMAIPFLQGLLFPETASSMVFVGYMLCSTILLGATIDYAIMMATSYMEHRRTKNKYDAVRHALAESSRTIITSAAIFTFAGFAIAFVSSLPATNVFGSAIMRGGICSYLLVITLLPQLLLLCDGLIRKTTWKGKLIMIDDRLAPEAPEVKEKYIPTPPPHAKKKRNFLSPAEREDKIISSILRSIDDPEYDAFADEDEEVDFDFPDAPPLLSSAHDVQKEEESPSELPDSQEDSPDNGEEVK